MVFIVFPTAFVLKRKSLVHVETVCSCIIKPWAKWSVLCWAAYLLAIEQVPGSLGDEATCPPCRLAASAVLWQGQGGVQRKPRAYTLSY